MLYSKRQYWIAVDVQLEHQMKGSHEKRFTTIVTTQHPSNEKGSIRVK